jgi:hypothetical protein
MVSVVLLFQLFKNLSGPGGGGQLPPGPPAQQPLPPPLPPSGPPISKRLLPVPELPPVQEEYSDSDYFEPKHQRLDPEQAAPWLKACIINILRSY